MYCFYNVSHYINNGSKVPGCVLDASKAFDTVDHGLLFQKLAKRAIPPVIRVSYRGGGGGPGIQKS